MTIRLLSNLLLVALIFLSGCGREKSIPVPAPRPVTVMTLQPAGVVQGQLRTGSVGSWKTEKLGFEISGRVQWVVEPGTEIQGRILGEGGTVLDKGTALGQLDPDRQQFAVDAAKAKVESALRTKEAMEVEIQKGIPARISSAKAALKLADIQYQRARKAAGNRSGSQEELDKAEADRQSAQAKLETEQAALKAKEAQVRSLEADRKQALQSLAEAERNKRDTTLYSAFQGQVAEVHVVPGSFVTQGQAALTVQMMHPIKIEVEVSAADSRLLRLRDQVSYTLTREDKKAKLRQATIYQIDAVADPETRTFTVTLLTANEKEQLAVPPELEGKPVARTPAMWPIELDFLPGGKQAMMIEQSAIRKDNKGHFVWKITNRMRGEVPASAGPILDVVKVRVTPGKQKVPFLGNWVFIPVSFEPDAKIDPRTTMVVGKLAVSNGEPDAWDGTKMLLDQSHWVMRPGDLVRVGLMGSTPAGDGLAVPMRAITEEQGKYYVFVAESTGTERKAKKVEVKLLDTDSLEATTLRRVQSVKPESLKAGTSLIVEGAHYLQDGEAVVIAAGAQR